MPDLEEPLWSKRLRKNQQKDEQFFREARKRDGRVIPYEAVESERETIDAQRSGKRGTPTGRNKTIVVHGTSVSVPQHRTVGVTSSDRRASYRASSAAIDRLRADAEAARVDRELRKTK